MIELVDTSAQGIRGRRRWTIAEKQGIVLETLEAGTSLPRVAQAYALNPNLVFHLAKAIARGTFEEQQ